MTNVAIISLKLLSTNVFPHGASDEFGVWSKDSSSNVRLTYEAPTNAVVAVEYTYTPEGPLSMEGMNSGMRWTRLNCGGLTNGVYNRLGPYPSTYPEPRGYYTNRASRNTITLPVPKNDRLFFRLVTVDQ